ncbi:MAG: LacI family DNA-binding transcriptional regulator [Candidatus Sulfotelmatobacter sp.]
MSERKTWKRKPNKAPSIYDVAKEARVSVFTVSAVINDKSHVGKSLKRRVEAAIKTLSYRPNLLARSLAKRRTQTIGIVVPDISNPFSPLVVRGAEDAAQKHGYNILLCDSDDRLEREQECLEVLLAKRVDGILLTKAPQPFPASLEQMIEDVKGPLVLTHRLVCTLVVVGDHRVFGPMKLGRSHHHNGLHIFALSLLAAWLGFSILVDARSKLVDLQFAFRTPSIDSPLNLEFRAEWFNLFNHTQSLGPSGIFAGSNSLGNFGQVTAAVSPRIGQLSLKLNFWEGETAPLSNRGTSSSRNFSSGASRHWTL